MDDSQTDERGGNVIREGIVRENKVKRRKTCYLPISTQVHIISSRRGM